MPYISQWPQVNIYLKSAYQFRRVPAYVWNPSLVKVWLGAAHLSLSLSVCLINSVHGFLAVTKGYGSEGLSIKYPLRSLVSHHNNG